MLTVATRVGTLIVGTIYLQLIQIDTCFEVLLSFSVVTSIVYNPLPAMWKSLDTFSSACCVDSWNGAVYRLKNLWNSSEANATKWFLHLRNRVSHKGLSPCDKGLSQGLKSQGLKPL